MQSSRDDEEQKLSETRRQAARLSGECSVWEGQEEAVPGKGSNCDDM